jgi:hypothetical protein
MTRKRIKAALMVPRNKIAVFCAIVVTVVVVTIALQWLFITRSNYGGNGEFFSDLPDVDFSVLQRNARNRLLRQANLQKCDCNCGLTLACCRNRDRSCQTSLKICRAMVKHASTGGQ